MAQEKEVKEKPKRTRKTQKSAKEKPYVEQINELLFVHNKEDPKAGVQAVSEIDGEGKVRTVPAEEKNDAFLIVTIPETLPFGNAVENPDSRNKMRLVTAYDDRTLD